MCPGLGRRQLRCCPPLVRCWVQRACSVAAFALFFRFLKSGSWVFWPFGIFWIQNLPHLHLHAVIFSPLQLPLYFVPRRRDRVCQGTRGSPATKVPRSQACLKANQGFSLTRDNKAIKEENGVWDLVILPNPNIWILQDNMKLGVGNPPPKQG